jgi:hypothetical protein
MKRTAENNIKEEVEYDSLIENMQLMNCLDSKDEYKLLRESYEIKFNLGELHFRQINEVLGKSFLRYKRYLKNVNMENLPEIESKINNYIKIYENTMDYIPWFIKYKQLMKIMTEIDGLIIDELDNYPATAKRYKNT